VRYIDEITPPLDRCRIISSAPDTVQELARAHRRHTVRVGTMTLDAMRAGRGNFEVVRFLLFRRSS